MDVRTRPSTEGYQADERQNGGDNRAYRRTATPPFPDVQRQPKKTAEGLPDTDNTYREEPTIKWPSGAPLRRGSVIVSAYAHTFLPRKGQPED